MLTKHATPKSARVASPVRRTTPKQWNSASKVHTIKYQQQFPIMFECRKSASACIEGVAHKQSVIAVWRAQVDVGATEGRIGQYFFME